MRDIAEEDIEHLNAAFKALARQIVGPAADADWTQPWHVTLHLWNLGVQHFIARANGTSPWDFQPWHVTLGSQLATEPFSLAGLGRATSRV